MPELADMSTNREYTAWGIVLEMTEKGKPCRWELLYRFPRSVHKMTVAKFGHQKASTYKIKTRFVRVRKLGYIREGA